MITPSNIDDLETIQYLAKEISDSASKSKSEEIKDKNLIFYCLKEDNQIIGYILIRKELDEAEIDEIVISKEKRRNGYGYQFLSSILRTLENQGIKKIFLEVRSKNIPAIHLYEKCGFQSYRLRKDYYQDDDAICYLKELDI